MRPDRVLLRLQLLRHGADADIEVAAGLGHVPAIAGQAALEEPQAAGAVAPIVGELLLQHGRLQRLLARRQLAEEGAMHRAAGPAGADQVPAAIGLVEHVPVAVAADLADIVGRHRRRPSGAAARRRTRRGGSSAATVLRVKPSPLKLSRSASKVRKLSGYSPGCSSRSRSTLGVTQPAHSLGRGNSARSSTRQSTPCRRSRQAQLEPGRPATDDDGVDRDHAIPTQRPRICRCRASARPSSWRARSRATPQRGDRTAPVRPSSRSRGPARPRPAR